MSQEGLLSPKQRAWFPKTISQKHQYWANSHLFLSKQPWHCWGWHILAPIRIATAGQAFSFLSFPCSRKLICLDQNEFWQVPLLSFSIWNRAEQTLHILFFSDITPKRADQAKMQHLVNQKGLSLLGIGSTTMVKSYFFTSLSSSHQLWTSLFKAKILRKERLSQ